MKIDYLQINSRFKNLDQVRINFDEDRLATVVVGWNGAGKSNVLEALVSIFRNLDLGESPKFAYEIKYKLGDGESETWVKVDADPARGDSAAKQYRITAAKGGEKDLFGEKNGQPIPLSKVARNKKDGQAPYLPRHLFAYYSGPSDSLETYFKRHRTDFYRRLLRNELHLKGEIRPLFYAKPIHSQFVLLAFFLAKDNSKELIFLKEQLGIEDLDSVHFVFRRPDWAKSANREELFWGASGVVREFLERVLPASLAPIKITRNEDTSLTGASKSNEFFHLFLPDREALRAVAGDLSPDEFFKMLESTLLSEIISEVRVRVKVKNVDQALSFRELSEGEQQLLTVLGLLKFTGGKDSLFLLDEPDTHLNP
ncbi:MAG: AAA family ATPase, partial [Anaerolineales bacterium]